MYLRKIEISEPEKSSESGSIIGILMLTAVLLAAVIMTSVSNTNRE